LSVLFSIQVFAIICCRINIFYNFAITKNGGVWRRPDFSKISALRIIKDAKAI